MNAVRTPSVPQREQWQGTLFQTASRRENKCTLFGVGFGQFRQTIPQKVLENLHALWRRGPQGGGDSFGFIVGLSLTHLKRKFKTAGQKKSSMFVYHFEWVSSVNKRDQAPSQQSRGEEDSAQNGCPTCHPKNRTLPFQKEEGGRVQQRGDQISG